MHLKKKEHPIRFNIRPASLTNF